MTLQADTFAQAEQIFKELSKFETEIYYTARVVGGKRVSLKMTLPLRAIMSYKKLGINFATTEMIGSLSATTENSSSYAMLISKLHNLGDRKILTLARSQRIHDQLYYCLSDVFLQSLPDTIQEFIGVPVTLKKREAPQ